jgi:Raf kinase inhibitor-like YbhB/YbcL family protein
MAGCGGLGTAVALAGCGLLSQGVTITAPAVMTVSSSAVVRGELPSRFTCAAPHVLSPPINWSGEPKGTRSIAIVVDDADAPISPYVFWIVFDIQPGTAGIAEGVLPTGAKQARGSAGYDRYDPPCPGSSGHSYRLTVYALNRVLNLPKGTSLMSAWRAIAAATIGRGRLPVNATS